MLAPQLAPPMLTQFSNQQMSSALILTLYRVLNKCMEAIYHANGHTKHFPEEKQKITLPNPQNSVRQYTWHTTINSY